MSICNLYSIEVRICSRREKERVFTPLLHLEKGYTSIKASAGVSSEHLHHLFYNLHVTKGLCRFGYFFDSSISTREKEYLHRCYTWKMVTPRFIPRVLCSEHLHYSFYEREKRSIFICDKRSLFICIFLKIVLY